MSWNRIKRVFKRKPKMKKDVVIDYAGGEIGLKIPLAYKLEPSEDEAAMTNIMIHTKYIGRAEGKTFEFEINKVRIIAEDIITAQRKYLEDYPLGGKVERYEAISNKEK